MVHVGNAIIAVFTGAGLLFISFVVALIAGFSSSYGEIYLYIIMAGAVLIELLIIGGLWGFARKKGFYLPIIILIGILIVGAISVSLYENYEDNIPTVGENENILANYTPYGENSKVAVLEEESAFKLTDDLPVLDGATALYPIYSGFARAVFPKETIEDIARFEKNDYLKCSTTTEAYRNIVTGEADIIFAALPSEEQQQFARDNGVELVYTPIGKEAFVFFVNAKNPIDNITMEQIRSIYSGKTTQWEELGVRRFGNIRAFQRDEGSGSQSTLQKLMAGCELMTPPVDDVIDGMGGIIKRTADYKNYKNAIGYSFRFYSTEMVKNNKIKLISIEGVNPSLENIENGTYPLASYFYAVTRKDADKKILDFLEWIKGEQGQKIIEMTGYTPLGK